MRFYYVNSFNTVRFYCVKSFSTVRFYCAKSFSTVRFIMLTHSVTTTHTFVFCILYFIHFVVQMGISPMGNSGRFPPRKASQLQQSRATQS